MPSAKFNKTQVSKNLRSEIRPRHELLTEQSLWGEGVVLAQNMGPSAVTVFVMNIEEDRTAVCEVEICFLQQKCI